MLLVMSTTQRCVTPAIVMTTSALDVPLKVMVVRSGEVSPAAPTTTSCVIVPDLGQAEVPELPLRCTMLDKMDVIDMSTCWATPRELTTPRIVIDDVPSRTGRLIAALAVGPITPTLASGGSRISAMICPRSSGADTSGAVTESELHAEMVKPSARATNETIS